MLTSCCRLQMVRFVEKDHFVEPFWATERKDLKDITSEKFRKYFYVVNWTRGIDCGGLQ